MFQSFSNQNITCFGEKLPKLDDILSGLYVLTFQQFKQMNFTKEYNALPYFKHMGMFNPYDDIDNCFIVTHGDSVWHPGLQDFYWISTWHLKEQLFTVRQVICSSTGTRTLLHCAVTWQKDCVKDGNSLQIRCPHILFRFEISQGKWNSSHLSATENV